MNLARTQKPHRVEGAFDGLVVCMTTNIPGFDPRAYFRRRGEKEHCASLRITRTSGCEVKILVHEELALLGEGYYEVVLVDECEECGTFPIDFDASCYITKAEAETAKLGKKCGC